MSNEWQLLLQQISQTDWIQWTAVILGVAEVLFAKANKIWLYPSGIASILLSVYILFLAGLYAECLLHGYYLVMSIYGWWYWKKKKGQPSLAITSCSYKDWKVVFTIIIAGFIVLFSLLKYFTPSTVPVWDAWVSAVAWAGMWLLAKRKIENWIVLNISNFFAIPLLFHKGLPLYAALTIFLFVIAIQGYIKWKRIMRSDSEQFQYSTAS
ncbi:nicotinamide riboside transporter PnuC [Terrimonas alba]|uniref:nicotinamide riboside transporter PnuC n=1 Tax=Terrimonas alba TaxID=3349636 RepID=UPI0035F4FC47